MKRLICILTALLLMLTFCSCADRSTSSDGDSIDVEYYARLGKIPECEYKIGDSVAVIKEKYGTEQASASDDSQHNHGSFEIVEGEQTVLLDCGSYAYYYYKLKEADGISYIVSFDTAFGFDIGDTMPDVKSAIGNLNPTQESMTADNAFFMPQISGDILKCSVGDYTVLFAFENDALCATALYLTADWL